ncbi:uncharacterized protein HD556DRAFT_1308338 [Suillus plorans]|uniref:MARVEL domain-containing protein n=1 Tax=Suillus plorans TaxID=116603 RepID=A0A9P7APL3_9AGAM|nr:uncharacterized protein HD556DRAFT_1308338 [Suillus plorans]KAG1793865.1 hypothetical protein HD556DRAFT_1308338 [Suillus plorans]
MALGWFSVARITLFSTAIAFSLIALGLNAYFISLTVPDDFYFTFSALGLATAMLTLFTIPVMLIVDFIRRGAFTSMVVFELSWLFLLAILWVATAGEAVSTFNFYYPQGCIYTDGSDAETYCLELQAVEAFAFLNFFIFLGYTGVLLAFSIIGSTRGNGVWTYSVKEATFLGQKSQPIQQQVPLSQYSGVPPTGYAPAVQPQQLGTYSTHSGTSPQSHQTQPQQFQPVYSGQPQGIPV